MERKRFRILEPISENINRSTELEPNLCRICTEFDSRSHQSVKALIDAAKDVGRHSTSNLKNMSKTKTIYRMNQSLLHSILLRTAA